MLLGIATATARLSGRFSAGAFVVGALFTVVAGLLERTETPSRAVDYTLSGAVFGWVVPLVAYAAVARASRDGRLDDAVLELARHGADRRRSAIGIVLATAARVATLAAAVAVLGVIAARGHLDRTALGDAFTSAWIGALGGGVYAAWFSLGSLFGKAGRGRAVLFALDWIFGAAPQVLSVPWPRAHLHSLLGGEAVAGLSSAGSSVALYGIAAFCLAATWFRLAP